MNSLQYLALMVFGIKLSSAITWTASCVEKGYTTDPSACFPCVEEISMHANAELLT